MKLSKTVVEMKSHPTKTASSAGIDFELTQEFSGSIHRRACRLPSWPIWAEAGIHLGKKIRPCLLKKSPLPNFNLHFNLINLPGITPLVSVEPLARSGRILHLFGLQNGGTKLPFWPELQIESDVQVSSPGPTRPKPGSQVYLAVLLKRVL